MERELEPWRWRIRTTSGTTLREETHGSIRSIPTQIVHKIGLENVETTAQVFVDFPRGVGEVSGHFGSFFVRPLLPDVALAPKIPIFFRRKGIRTDGSGEGILFRTVGFASMKNDGTPAQICLLRVFNDRIETKYHTQWDPSVIRHCTGQNIIVGV